MSRSKTCKFVPFARAQWRHIVEAGMSRFAFIKTGGGSGIALAIVTTLLLSSASINVLLARKVQRLTRVVDLIRADAKLAIGASVPPIAVKALDGHPLAINYDPTDPPTLLYVLTPSCGWCIKNLANIKALAEQAHTRFRIIGLSLSSDNLRDYVISANLTFPVYEISAEGARAYKLGGTPQSLVISPDGKVLKNWGGAYTGTVQKEIEEYFGVRLPGLTDEKAREEGLF